MKKTQIIPSRLNSCKIYSIAQNKLKKFIVDCVTWNRWMISSLQEYFLTLVRINSYRGENILFSWGFNILFQFANLRDLFQSSLIRNISLRYYRFEIAAVVVFIVDCVTWNRWMISSLQEYFLTLVRINSYLPIWGIYFKVALSEILVSATTDSNLSSTVTNSLFNHSVLNDLLLLLSCS